MVMDQTTTARHPAGSKLRLSRNEVIAAGPVEYTKLATSATGVKDAIDFDAPVPRQHLSEAIEEQRLSLLNVLGIVRCIGKGVADGEKDPAPEIATAFELLGCEIQRIATALEKLSLRSSIRAIQAAARVEIRRRKLARLAARTA
jgi:hypothetical protein